MKDCKISVFKKIGNESELIMIKIKRGEWFGKLSFFVNFALNINSAKCFKKAILIELTQSNFEKLFI